MGSRTTYLSLAIVSLLIVLTPFSVIPFQLDNEEQLFEPVVESYAGSVGNHSIGGYHIATGDWWEAEQPFTVSGNDWDGDGTSNGADNHPLDPSMPTRQPLRGKSCLVPIVN